MLKKLFLFRLSLFIVAASSSSDDRYFLASSFLALESFCFIWYPRLCRALKLSCKNPGTWIRSPAYAWPARLIPKLFTLSLVSFVLKVTTISFTGLLRAFGIFCLV